jgi:hypothetical protein
VFADQERCYLKETNGIKDIDIPPATIEIRIKKVSVYNREWGRITHEERYPVIPEGWVED